MEDRLIKTSIHKARKTYRCDSADWITECGILENPSEYEVTFADMRKLVKMKQEGFKILQGTKYIASIGICEEEFYYTKSRIDVIEICRKYDLWEF